MRHVEAAGTGLLRGEEATDVVSPHATWMRQALAHLERG
jgi:hypothetical protein